jgi:hypothetical protein
MRRLPKAVKQLSHRVRSQARSRSRLCSRPRSRSITFNRRLRFAALKVLLKVALLWAEGFLGIGHAIALPVVLDLLGRLVPLAAGPAGFWAVAQGLAHILRPEHFNRPGAGSLAPGQLLHDAPRFGALRRVPFVIGGAVLLVLPHSGFLEAGLVGALLRQLLSPLGLTERLLGGHQLLAV